METAKRTFSLDGFVCSILFVFSPLVSFGLFKNVEVQYVVFHLVFNFQIVFLFGLSEKGKESAGCRIMI